MTTLSVPTKYTPQEVTRLSDQDRKLYELVGGNLVEKIQVSTQANWVAGQIAFLLKTTYPASRAYVFPEQPTYCFPDGEMRRPDVALVWAERLPEGLNDDELHVAPDLVVEVVSPTNRFDEQVDRVADYLDAGVPIVLVAQPARRWIHVYRKDESVALLRAKDTLKDEPLLPGLILPVADCFPAVTVQKVGT
jgi:Uma2 family endonuclease